MSKKRRGRPREEEEEDDELEAFFPRVYGFLSHVT